MSKKKYGVYRIVAIVNEIQSWIDDITWDQNGYKIVEAIVILDRECQKRNNMLKAIINRPWRRSSSKKIDGYKVLEEILPGQYAADELHHVINNCMTWYMLDKEHIPYEQKPTYDPGEAWGIVDQVSEYLGLL